MEPHSSLTQPAPSRDLQAPREARSTAPTLLPKNYLLERVQSAGLLGGLSLKSLGQLYLQSHLWPWEPKNSAQDPTVRVMLPPPLGAGSTHASYPFQTQNQGIASPPLPCPCQNLGVHPPASPACELLRRVRKRKRLIKDSIVATPLLQRQKRCGNRLSLPWVLSTSVGGTKRTWQLDFLVFPEQFS